MRQILAQREGKVDFLDMEQCSECGAWNVQGAGCRCKAARAQELPEDRVPLALPPAKFALPAFYPEATGGFDEWVEIGGEG